jgi:hypothetical protein
MILFFDGVGVLLPDFLNDRPEWEKARNVRREDIDAADWCSAS